MHTIGWPNWSILIFGAVMAVGFVWRTEYMRRTSGVNPYRLKADDSPMGEIGKWYKLTTIAIMTYIVTRCFLDIDGYMGPFSALLAPSVQWAGVGVTSFGILWALTAQAQMGASWRIGIPDAGPDGKADGTPGALVDTGLYAVSRNPFFLGGVLFNLGLFLMIPNWFMAAAALTSWMAVNVQVRLEEEFLTREIGDAYTAYKGKVRRWI